MDVDRSIWAEGLTRDFADLKAVDGVDLSIESGRIFGFLGPNGSGKTTMVRMLTTILKPTAGSARVAGFDVSEEPGGSARARGSRPAGSGAGRAHDRSGDARPAGQALPGRPRPGPGDRGASPHHRGSG